MPDSSGQPSAARGARRSRTARTGPIGRLLARFLRRRREGSDGAVATRATGLQRLRTVPVSEVLIPRAEVEAVPDDVTLEELVEAFRRTGFTRLPVYHETLDEPLGLIHLKDLALEYGFGRNGRPFQLRPLVRPILYAPPSMAIGTLMGQMKAARVHMALVIDEYGGVEGLVTLEDLIEEVLGEIEDEHDVQEAPLWREERPDVWLAQATAPLEEFEAATGLGLTGSEQAQDVDTLGGLVFAIAGRVPARGEVIPGPDGIEFEVVDADPRRIRRLRVRRRSAPGDRAASAPDAAG